MQLKKLNRISPSRFSTLRKCPYRVVLANSYSDPLLPYPPASHLGNIIHECIRLIVTNEIKSNSEFDEKWNRLLVHEEKLLEDMGFGFFTPLSGNVSGYTIKKLQVKTLCKSWFKTEVPENRKTAATILTEKWLESQDSMIGGFADIIINMNGYIKLSDFKSGKILLAEGEVKEDYEYQLKLYAYLHDEVFGKYPDELSIIDLEKKEYSIAFTPEECEVLAGKAREALMGINGLIEKDDLEALAKPDLDNCKSCLYRPACDFYWNLPLSESDSVFRDVRGTITLVREFHNGDLNVNLYMGDKVLTVSHINNKYLTFLNDLIGKEVAFFNIRQSGIPDSFQALKTTKVYEA